jgi:hypothetical protein
MTRGVTIALTALHLTLLALLSGRGAPAAGEAAEPVAPRLRTRALELVDERGQVRSRLIVEADGEVVLRLIDRTGTIRVKLGAGEGGSGLLLLDETTEPGIQLIARRAASTERPATTRLMLRGADGRERVLEP